MATVLARSNFYPAKGSIAYSADAVIDDYYRYEESGTLFGTIPPWNGTPTVYSDFTLLVPAGPYIEPTYENDDETSYGGIDLVVDSSLNGLRINNRYRKYRTVPEDPSRLYVYYFGGETTLRTGQTLSYSNSTTVTYHYGPDEEEYPDSEGSYWYNSFDGDGDADFLFVDKRWEAVGMRVQKQGSILYLTDNYYTSGNSNLYGDVSGSSIIVRPTASQLRAYRQ